MKARTNAEWLVELKSDGEEQHAALSDLRTYLLRAARYALYRSRNKMRHLAQTDIEHLAEDCAQDAMSALLEHLQEFRGESRFTTWAYNFAVNAALVAARRESWRRVPLDHLLDSFDLAERVGRAGGALADPQRRASQAQMLAVIREAIDEHITERQRQALTAVVFEGVPLDELARLLGSNRNAVYKLLHDARRKLKAHLRTRGFAAKEILETFSDR